MKALVLSGGSGTRLRPFSHSMPKQLVPVANRAVLEHVLDGVRQLGVRDVGVVVGDRGAQVAAAIGDGSRLGVRVTYIAQDRPAGLAHALLVARPFLGDHDFVLQLGDVLLPDGFVDIAADFRRARPAAHLATQKVADPRAYGVVELDRDGTVRRLVEKPTDPRSELVLVGVYFFTSAIHDAVRGIRPSPRGELELTDAIQWLVDSGYAVRASEYAGYWQDVGSARDLLAANRTLLARLRHGVDGEVDTGSVLVPPVAVGTGARIAGSRVDGPAVIGDGAVVEASVIGPNVTIGRGCVVRSARLSNSIVMDQARISDVDAIDGSVIGRSATVEGGGGRRVHRLLVGDHAQVEISG